MAALERALKVMYIGVFGLFGCFVVCYVEMFE